MKIFIGNYINWWGPYQIVGLLQKVGLSKNWCDKLGKWTNDTPICTFCNWIENKRKRKIQVRIDDYDTWSMDSTLAYIILPMLKQFKDTKYGSPDIDWHDIPEELRSTSAPKKENDWVVDEYWHERWDWVLDEMIWAFSQVNEDWQDQYHKRYVDMSGENHPMWKGGISYDMKEYQKEYQKEYNKEYRQTPEYKAYKKKYDKKPERKAYQKEYNAERYARKKAERQAEKQGVGTLDAFLK